MPYFLRSSKTSVSVLFQSHATALSENPAFFAWYRTSLSFTYDFSSASISIIFFILLRKKGSIPVWLEIFETPTPDLKSCAIANILSFVPVFISSIHTWRSSFSNFFMCRWFTPVSKERTAFNRLSSNVLPTLITSPVAFICVPSFRFASVNLSNGKRGIFVTT